MVLGTAGLSTHRIRCSPRCRPWTRRSVLNSEESVTLTSMKMIDSALLERLVTEAEAVGAVHDQGVGVGDVNAVFDDGGGEEEVDFALLEAVKEGVGVVGQASKIKPIPMSEMAKRYASGALDPTFAARQAAE